MQNDKKYIPAFPAAGMTAGAARKAFANISEMDIVGVGPPQSAWITFNEVATESESGFYIVPGNGASHRVRIPRDLRQEWEPLQATHRCLIVREGLRPGAMAWTDWVPGSVDGQSPLYPIAGG